MGLLPVADALAMVLAGIEPLGMEYVPLKAARGRVIASPVAALRTQPGFDASAMDGYALRFEDGRTGNELAVIGESAAGHGFYGQVGPGQAVRIFTGAPLPEGADTIIIQENTRRHGGHIVLEADCIAEQNIRRRGLDFPEGRPALTPGTIAGPRDIALAAAMNHARLPVRRRPRVAILATGDELVNPGDAIGKHQTISSNSFAVAALAEAEGADILDLGIASDDYPSLEAAIHHARREKADILITIGGASIGDHDLVQTALIREGMELGFWKIAMRPGKPLLHGRLGNMRILGLPGNPAAATLCALLFMVPMLHALAGRKAIGVVRRKAIIATALPANDFREDYLRATLETQADGQPVAKPFALQDSSLVSILQQASCLIVRPPYAPPVSSGDICEIIDLTTAGY